MTAWPGGCPTCGAPWDVRSKTLGSDLGQPHKGRCRNGHWWFEPAAEEEATG